MKYCSLNIIPHVSFFHASFAHIHWVFFLSGVKLIKSIRNSFNTRATVFESNKIRVELYKNSPNFFRLNFFFLKSTSIATNIENPNQAKTKSPLEIDILDKDLFISESDVESETRAATVFYQTEVFENKSTINE